MLIQSQSHLRFELVKWVLLLFLAASLALLFASIATGDKNDITDTPVPLPMKLQPASDLPEAAPIPSPLEPTAGQQELFHESMKIWQAIDTLRDLSAPEKAITEWSAVRLPPDSEVWRHLAIGLSHLRAHNLNASAQALDTARTHQPDNALVHYFTGLLRLRQAGSAPDWQDAHGATNVQFVSYDPVKVVPNSRAMHELAAEMELHRATVNASNVLFGQYLLPAAWSVGEDGMSMPIMSPTVYDFLLAADAVDFEGKAHLVLGELKAQRGQMENAEQHLDAASDLGQATGKAFRVLGDRYEEAHEHQSATRAYLKAMGREEGLVLPAKKALDSLLDTIIGHSIKRG